MIFGNFGGPGAHFRGPRAHFEDFGDCCDFGSARDTDYSSPFGSKLMTPTHFWQCCVFNVFLSARFFFVFCDFGCPETPFWLPFCLPCGSPGPLEKLLEVYNCAHFKWFDPFQTEAF